MKKLFLTLSLIFFMSATSFSQKYAYVDTDYILKNIPEYADAQDQLNELSAKFQKEVEAKYSEIDSLYKAYQAEAVLLPEDMKTKKENEIIALEKEAKDLKMQRFGSNGDIFKKRQELVKPIQEKIYNAIQEIAENRTYAVIFDKAGSLSMLYTNPKYDISDDVLDKLGYSYNIEKK